MARGQLTKETLQVVEFLAFFKAGEAASDAVQKNSKANRAAIAKSEYKAWLDKFAGDPGMIADGMGFVEKKRSDGSVWNIEASVEARANDILKKHKEIVARCRKTLMPAYFAFFTKLGKMPSGTDRDDAIRAVKEAC